MNTEDHEEFIEKIREHIVKHNLEAEKRFWEREMRDALADTVPLLLGIIILLLTTLIILVMTVMGFKL